MHSSENVIMDNKYKEKPSNGWAYDGVNYGSKFYDDVNSFH